MVALVLETAITKLTEPIEEYGTGECIFGLALVQTDLHAPAQLDVCSQSSVNNVRSTRPSSRSATASPFWRWVFFPEALSVNS
jgi:hypothetical protein